ncbi:DUF3037 domain-containing protein [Niabella insulamsoli]|uniref:DUF3037 domain-containing protein n=1 Tax=Niabella insulamsoli TaxID=3144874 RepID=UPI0031FD2BE7
MQEAQLYEYAVIRVVPKVEREEFLNAGIVMFCKKTRHIGCRILLNEKRLQCFDKDIDLNFVYANLKAFEAIALGADSSQSPISRLDAASRFRWLTATRSTIIQCSRVHPGLSHDLNITLDQLMESMVL